eukprot:3260449-Amphidinium_carterae.1
MATLWSRHWWRAVGKRRITSRSVGAGASCSIERSARECNDGYGRADTFWKIGDCNCAFMSDSGAKCPSPTIRASAGSSTCA